MAQTRCVWCFQAARSHGTVDGGGAGDGTVFKINIDGTGYVRLHDFSGTNNAGFNADGAFPQSGLVLSGNELYGTAMAGGSLGNGTVFMLDTNGQNFITLHSFTATNAITGTNADGCTHRRPSHVRQRAIWNNQRAGGAAGYGTVYAIVFPRIFDHCPFGNECDPKLANRRHRLQFAIRHQTWLPMRNWAIVSGQNTVTNPISGHQKFFRLARP